MFSAIRKSYLIEQSKILKLKRDNEVADMYRKNKNYERCFKNWQVSDQFKLTVIF